jgi:SAM-dependent methyltransferase
MVHPSAATGFARSVDAYERARPEYPPEAIAWLARELDLRPGRTVVDLAAGSGKLTRPLAALGCEVIAIEPVAEMRAAIGPTARALDGTAEAMPLPDDSADAVTVGQAFHWFDADAAVAEIARVLRPGGALAPIWNIRDLADPLQARVHELLLPARRGTPSEHEQPWREVLAAAHEFRDAERASFPFAQLHTTEELVDRIASVSFVACLEPGARGELLAAVRAEVEGLPQPFEFRYRTDVFVFRRA